MTETCHLFTMTLQSQRHGLGETPWGQRRLVIVMNAHIEGPRIKASLLPGAGSDWVRDSNDGITMLDCRMVFRTDDDALINVRYEGLRHAPQEVAARINRGEHFEPSEVYHRVAVFFETAALSYLWLNRLLAIGLIRPGPSGPVYEVFEVL